MNCVACHHENRPGAKLCEECAAPLARSQRVNDVVYQLGGSR